MTGSSRTSRRRLRLVAKGGIFLTLFTLSVGSLPVRAAVLLWDKFGNGNFNDANNWFGGGPPGANDFVKFELGWGPYTVTFPGNPLVIGGGGGGGGAANFYSSHLRVRDNALIFTGSTQPFVGSSTYTITSADETESNRGIIIGEWGGENASLSLSHSGIVCCGGLSSFTGVAATLGDQAGAAGTLNVGVGAFNVTGSDFTQTQLIVGNHGTGTLNVTNGADVTVPGFNSRTSLGHNADGSGTVSINGVGSTWTSANELWVGEKGAGTLNVLNGGSLITNGSGGTDSAIIGTFNGSNGAVNVTGAGSTWANSATLRVGNSGNGTLTVQNGGSFVNTGGAITEIGGGGTASGLVTVTGAGSTWNSDGAVYIGSTGQALMTVQNGGSVTMPRATIRALNGGTAHVRLLGPGSTLNVTSGPLTIGMPEPGFTTGPTSLTINPGTAVSVAQDIDLDTNGLLKLQGGTLTVGTIGSQDLLSGYIEGVFEWTSGTLHAGMVHSSVTNPGGVLAPGTLLGRTTIDGNYTQLVGATMAIDIGGATPTTQHDFVYVEGAAMLGGELALSLISGFEPAAGQTFTILDSLNPVSGAFDNVASGQRVPTVDGLGSFQVDYGTNSAFDSNLIVLSKFQSNATASDFDLDGDVDGDDLAEWKERFGANGGAEVETDGNDFLEWQRNFGKGVQTPLQVGAVPEPATLVLSCLAAVSMAASMRRTRAPRS